VPTGRAATPEMEFVLRTMFEMRMDVEDLRREFELYRARHRDGLAIPGTHLGYGVPISLSPPGHLGPLRQEEAPEEVEAREEGTVVFRPGMTMEDLEREAIGAALLHSRGNRRRAAEMLGIGERTLYRKLKEYEIEA
jgi:DNA-binding NtrC family response regulator